MSNEIVPPQPESRSFRSLILRKLTPGGKEDQERLVELTQRVVAKLVGDISERGMVSLFHEKETGTLDAAIFTVYLTSHKLPSLRVMLWGENSQPSQSSLAAEQRLFGVTIPRQFIEAFENEPSRRRRGIAVVKRRDTNENSYEIEYRRDVSIEAANMPIPRSIGEKMRFLQEILEATVDESATECHFGRPYHPGDTRSSSKPDDPVEHRAYWVRDLREQCGLPDTEHIKLIE